MAKFYKREIDLPKELNKIMKESYPGREVCCARQVTDSMGKDCVFYRSAFARNNAEGHLVCMMLIEDLKKKHRYNRLLGFDNKANIILDRIYEAVLSEEQSKKIVYKELEKAPEKELEEFAQSLKEESHQGHLYK